MYINRLIISKLIFPNTVFAMAMFWCFARCTIYGIWLLLHQGGKLSPGEKKIAREALTKLLSWKDSQGVIVLEVLKGKSVAKKARKFAIFIGGLNLCCGAGAALFTWPVLLPHQNVRTCTTANCLQRMWGVAGVGVAPQHYPKYNIVLYSIMKCKQFLFLILTKKKHSTFFKHLEHLVMCNWAIVPKPKTTNLYLRPNIQLLLCMSRNRNRLILVKV
jgi:hypothetical protein